MTVDKTGAPTTVTAEAGRYIIAVDGKTVGFADFADRDDQRVFYHTEIDPAYGGRGLATILVAPDEHRLQDAQLPDRRGQIGEALLVEVDAGLVRVGLDGVDQLLDPIQG